MTNVDRCTSIDKKIAPHLPRTDFPGHYSIGSCALQRGMAYMCDTWWYTVRRENAYTQTEQRINQFIYFIYRTSKHYLQLHILNYLHNI